MKVLIRDLTIHDAQKLLELSNEVLEEDRWFVSCPGEGPSSSVDLQKKWMEKVVCNHCNLLIVAEIDGLIVGMLDFHQNETKGRLNHTGSFSIAVLKDFRGIGIGCGLINYLVDWGNENPEIEKIEVNVLSTNEEAFCLFKKIGFEEEGRKLHQVKYSDGTYAHEIMMALWVG